TRRWTFVNPKWINSIAGWHLAVSNIKHPVNIGIAIEWTKCNRKISVGKLAIIEAVTGYRKTVRRHTVITEIQIDHKVVTCSAFRHGTDTEYLAVAGIAIDRRQRKCLTAIGVVVVTDSDDDRGSTAGLEKW